MHIELNKTFRTPPRPGKQVLIVIGMHRSGTSAITGALKCLGVQLGKKLYSGHRDINAKGYFEHSDIADTNEEILLSLGSSWDDILCKEDAWWAREEIRPFVAKIRQYIRRDFSHSPLWAVKDPRICRLLPLWLDILVAEGISPHFLFVVRSPSAVYRSLERRDGFSEEKSFLLWLMHYLEAERGSRSYPRAFTLFDRFLDNPKDELLRIEQQLGLQFPLAVEASTDCLSQFLTKNLRHQMGSDEKPSGTPINNLAFELESRLEQAARMPATKQIDINTDDLWRQIENIQRDFPPMLIEHLRSVSHQRGKMELAMNRVWRSWSKYAGKPIRFLERMFGRNV